MKNGLIFATIISFTLLVGGILAVFQGRANGPVAGEFVALTVGVLGLNISLVLWELWARVERLEKYTQEVNKNLNERPGGE